MSYSYSKTVGLDFDSAVRRVGEVLKDHGFGILTQVDVQATLRDKLGIEFDKYIILGICNPQLAYQALQAEYQVGLFLPCGLIVYQKDNQVSVAVLRPTTALSVVDNPTLNEIAKQAEVKLKAVIDKV